jgi:hypothetical protein
MPFAKLLSLYVAAYFFEYSPLFFRHVCPLEKRNRKLLIEERRNIEDWVRLRALEECPYPSEQTQWSRFVELINDMLL